MRTYSYALPKRSPLIGLLALVILLPLLAACGGGAAQAPSSTTGGGVVTGGDTSADSTHRSVPAPASPPAAAAPTSAGAAAEPAALPEASKSDDIAAAPASGIAGGGTGPSRPANPPVRANNQQGGAPLKAGDVDDNADFAQYLEYLNSYNGPPARRVDVAERYLITVVNEQQQPVLDARVRLFDGQQQVFEGRTYAGGKTIFFPRAIELSANINTLRLQIEKGNSVAEGQLAHGQDGAQTIVLRGATALPATPRLDVLFLLDATGSMGDEIGQIQNTIASIAERIDRITPRPELRFGLVAYRDRGDEYITRAYDFTPDVAQFQQLLSSVRADGGGDTPESLNEGLHNAVQGVNWADDAVRLTFLVADAPPHLDYQQDFDYVRETQQAVARGIKIYTIAASNTDDQAEYVLRQLAQQTLAHFIFLTYQPGQNAGTPGDSTVHHVDPEAFTVERLDDLVVQAIEREMATARGAA